MAGRSHNVAAQATTLGKRFATVADELLVAVERVEELLARYPLRGIKGPMGTSQDMLDLLDGDADRLAELERRVADHLGFERVLTSVGQVYPRSLDFDVLSAVVQLVAAPSNLATTIRLMAGLELVTEGFAEGQVGSSAMPHKMNTRSCERVNGLAVVTRGYLSMVGELAGDQWNEGDVSCSVVRRVALPDAFFAADGLFQTFLTVLDEFGAFPAVIQRELDRYLPFLATTKVLMAAVRRGVGREIGHEAIKQAAVGTALAMRQGQAENDVFDRLAADDRLGLTRADIDALVADPIDFTGAAVAQTQAVVRARRGARGPPPRGCGVLARRDPLRAALPRAAHVAGISSPRVGCSALPRSRMVGMSAPVTVSVTRHVDPSQSSEMREWVQAGTSLAERFDGFLGSGWVRPSEGSPEWHMLYRFADAEALAAWEASPQRAWWLEAAEGNIEATHVEKRTGIEGWFDAPPGEPAAPPPAPPRWKQMVVIFLVFFPLSLAANAVAVGDPRRRRPAAAGAAVVLAMTPLMTYVFLPWITRRMQWWLNPRVASSS